MSGPQPATVAGWGPLLQVFVHRALDCRANRAFHQLQRKAQLDLNFDGVLADSDRTYNPIAFYLQIVIPPLRAQVQTTAHVGRNFIDPPPRLFDTQGMLSPYLHACFVTIILSICMSSIV